jgi:VIT1/CCC1 family predicted Fe2+/Mn2+ transporter
VDISLTDLFIMGGISLVAIAVAVNTHGPARTAINGIIAGFLVVCTAAMYTMGYRSNQIREEFDNETAQMQEAIAAASEHAAKRAIEEQKALQRAQMDEAEKQRLAELAEKDELVKAYLREAKLELREVKNIAQTVLKVELSDLTSLSDSEYEAQMRKSQTLRYRANKAAADLKAIRAPQQAQSQHQILLGTAEHLVQAGLYLSRFWNAENGAQEEKFRTGAKARARAVLKSIADFEKGSSSSN